MSSTFRRFLLLCGALLSPLPVLAQAGALQPQDFASGREIRLGTGNAPFYRLELPADVYGGTAWPDLRDLRVFNADGEALPHSLLAPSASTTTPPRVSLQVYRLEVPAAGGAQQLEVQHEGERLSLQLSTAARGHARTEYLLVAPAPQGEPPRLRSLHLSWTPQPGNWQQRVSVYGSTDLKNWVGVASDMPLLQLNDGAQSLVQGDVPLDGERGHAFRYWRLHFGGETAVPALSAVNASPPASREEKALLEVFTAAGTPQADGSAVYLLPATQRANAIRIVPAVPNSVLPLQVEARGTEGQPWQTLHRGVAYWLAGPDSRQSYSPDLRLPLATDVQALRLRPLGPGWGANPPQLTVLRETRELVFNARGRGPFLLAWGTRAASETALPLKTLVPAASADSIAGLPTAWAGEAVTLGGPERLTALAPAERSALQKKWLVWAALIAGVLALGALAWRVWKESRAA
ncbi:DUF3999 domain-containing protein [Uliginosibacterium sp. H1]|uniref:DUF3999 domain-containing protein n=1 Tax=Uliginosibacterium sp. H1 TaxID=3114757 RepID=UPI002E17A39F|nr:DUF3999 domain-containing protein [Uliginosibacterium sp. H1]